MHPAFEIIQFGPFASSYHRLAVNDDCKKAFYTFLETEFLLQIEEPFEPSTGRLVAAFDDPKYCGPLSLVRDIYQLEFVFHRMPHDDEMKLELVFDAKNKAFALRRKEDLYRWTSSRSQRHMDESQAMYNICTRITKNRAKTKSCPLCSAPLTIVDKPSSVDVRCPNQCFQYHCHRQPVDGEIIQESFYRKTPFD
jgi:hypothetical protein